MLAVNAIAVQFLGPVMNLIKTATNLKNLEGHVERINDIQKIQMEREATERRRAAGEPVRRENPRSRRTPVCSSRTCRTGQTKWVRNWTSTRT